MIKSNDTPKEEVLNDFRQAWHEAMTGQGIPIDQLWQELENEGFELVRDQVRPDPPSPLNKGEPELSSESLVHEETQLIS